jgi:hypothetical protein
MKWARPNKLIETEVKEPIRGIAVIAVMAMILAGLALFIALGKESNAAPIVLNS